MGYLSFDASVKIHMSGRYTSTKTSKAGNLGIYGYIRHIDRETCRRSGCEVGHSNSDINPNFTLLNESYYKNESGEWKRTKCPKDMVLSIQRRVDYAKKHGARIYDGGKNDTTIVRPMVVQLDPDTIAGHEDTWVEDTIGILENMFGRDNITGYSIHRDETNVHMHVCFVPVYEYEDKNGKQKCSVSQTRYFTCPQSLANMHRKLRKNLKNKGYNVELENKPVDEQVAGYYKQNGERKQIGLTPEQLKQLSELQIKNKRDEVEIMLRKEELANLEQAMKELQKSAKMKQEKLEREQEILSVQKAAVERDSTNVQAQLQALAMEKLSVRDMKKEAEKMLENALSISDTCDRILSEEKHLNKKFLEFCDREGQQRKQPTREFVEYLYKKFLRERKENLTPLQEELWRIRGERLKGNNGKSASGNSEPNIILTDSASDYPYM